MTIYPGGFFYQDHCLLIKTYSAPKIRWRYIPEPWREIEGDDYTTELTEDYSANTYYRFVYREGFVSGGVIGWRNEVVRNGSRLFNGIQSWRLKVQHTGGLFYPVDNRFFTFVYDDEDGWVPAPISERNAAFYVEVISQGVITTIFLGSTSALWGIRFQPIDPNLRKTQCVFKVFRNGAVVYSETRNVCPEVEKIPCQADPVVSLDIETIPLGYIVTSVEALEPLGGEPIPYPYVNFPNCIHVYLFLAEDPQLRWWDECESTS